VKKIRVSGHTRRPPLVTMATTTQAHARRHHYHAQVKATQVTLTPVGRKKARYLAPFN